MGPHVTVNDVWVSCITYAVSRQLQAHRQHHQAVNGNDENFTPLKHHEQMNVVIPVHLRGGILMPGESVGNNIGAFVARVPAEGSHNAKSRLDEVHSSLLWVKQTPAPLLSYGFAKLASNLLPSRLNQWLFTSTNANACVAISNTRSSPKILHMDGRAIESVAGFLPLPPGIPIGCGIQSYAGTVSLSVTAEPWAVPDPDVFLGWVLEEYQRLVDEADA